MQDNSKKRSSSSYLQNEKTQTETRLIKFCVVGILPPEY